MIWRTGRSISTVIVDPAVTEAPFKGYAIDTCWANVVVARRTVHAIAWKIFMVAAFE